jgi:tetratricopeptide (TPR) repeat protein
VADLQKAADQIASKKIPDAPENSDPGVSPGPEASGLHFGVYYHLGLVYYLKGDYAGAEKAYGLCREASGTSADSQIACTRWLYVSLRRLGKDAEAKALLGGVTKDSKLTSDSAPYLDLLLLHQGVRTPAELLALAEGDLDHATYGYGVGEWLLLSGQKEKALALFREVVRGRQWAAFGRIAAEVEVARASAHNVAR